MKTKKTPVKSATKKTPVKSATKKTPVKSATKKTPVKLATKKTPVKSATKKTPVKSANKSEFIFLDNNGTTLICNEAKKEYIKWLQCYNASSNSQAAKSAKLMIENAKNKILNHCGTTSDKYTVIFTSGATESNCFILRSCAESYKRIKKITPHIIISSIEHHSVLECAKYLKEDGYAEITLVKPNIYGCILPSDVEKEIKPNTCLISIMYANNETGSINNIPKIGEIAHKYKIPLHSDSVQIFGKYPINLEKSNIDALSASFHKFYGPKGIGLLIIKNELIEGYKLKSQICGSQQNGLRGGTENIPAIASAIASLEHTFKNRKIKNSKLLKMRNYILENLEKRIKIGEYKDYLNKLNQKKENEIVILGPPKDKNNFYLPNTILLSIAKNLGNPFCNVKFKKDLDSNGIIVSISSACLTSSDKASHVLTSIRAPPVIKRGVLRISMGDSNTLNDVKKFVRIFMEVLNKHL